MKLLEELGKVRTKEGKIFQSFYSKWSGKPFESANSLRKWLERRVNEVKLPEGNNANVHW